MKRVVTAQGAQAIDHDAIAVKGISGTGLMWSAGTAVANAVRTLCSNRNLDTVQIFCGKGNNGGDGYVAAIKLKEYGFQKIEVVCFADADQIGGDAGVFYHQMLSTGINPIHIKSVEALCPRLKKNRIWVDAIFGTGLDRPVEGFLEDVLRCLNRLHDGQPVCAVDIPSGISGTSGKRLGSALKADITVTLGFYKSGNFLQDGKSYCGELILAPLDYPESSYTKATPPANLCDHELITDILNPVSITGHKYTAGQVLCAGGSAAMPGAVTLASLAALRSGAGMLRAYLPGSIKDIFFQQLVEGIVTPGCHPDHLVPDDLDHILALQEKSRSFILGPGIGRDPRTGELVRALVAKTRIPTVLDADALFHITPEDLKHKQNVTVITPHWGEFSRLTGLKTDDISNDPIRHALDLAAGTNTIVHLKSSTSLTALPSGRVYLHPTGAPGMATAGSGDLLAGMIASFIAQGHEPEHAVLIAAYYHGTAGQAAAETWGNRSMIASDILKYLAGLLKKDEVLV